MGALEQLEVQVRRRGERLDVDVVRLVVVLLVALGMRVLSTELPAASLGSVVLASRADLAQDLLVQRS